MKQTTTDATGPAQQQPFDLPPEPGSRDAVDDNVQAAVEDVEDVGDGDDDVKDYGVDIVPLVDGGAVVDQAVECQDTPGRVERKANKSSLE